MCPLRDIDEADIIADEEMAERCRIMLPPYAFEVRWVCKNYHPQITFETEFEEYNRVNFHKEEKYWVQDEGSSLYFYFFPDSFYFYFFPEETKIEASVKIAAEIVRLFRTMVDGKISIVYKKDAKDCVYFEQYVTPSFPLNQGEIETAISNILKESDCKWEERSEDCYVPENVVLYLNKVSENVFKSIGLKCSVGEEQHNAIPLKYEIGYPKKSPFYMPHPIYPSILEPNRKYIDSGFEDAKSSYTNSKILIDIKLLQSHKELFQYRIYLAIAMLYFYECAHFLMDNGFVLEDGILHLDKHSVKYLAYLTLESDNIAEVTMEESIATAFMLNCIKTVAPDDYPVAEKIVQETWSPACRFGLKQLEVGAKWQDWREAKARKNEWFEKYFSNGNINDSIAYEPKDYKRALGLS